MIKPYNNKLYESSNMMKCAKKFYSIIKTENIDANGLFILKDIDNNKLYKFQITKHNNQIGGLVKDVIKDDNVISKLNDDILQNNNITQRIENLENKIQIIENFLDKMK